MDECHSCVSGHSCVWCGRDLVHPEPLTEKVLERDRKICELEAELAKHRKRHEHCSSPWELAVLFKQLHEVTNQRDGMARALMRIRELAHQAHSKRGPKVYVDLASIYSSAFDALKLVPGGVALQAPSRKKGGA